MASRRTATTLLIVAAVGIAATFVWGEITAQDVKKIAFELRPYQVLSGQTSSANFEVIYILDNEAKKLAIMKYDSVKGLLVPIGGRYLAKDFESDSAGTFSMATTQLSGQTGLLYVTDAGTHRAMVYQVDLTANKVTPQQPIELKKLFNE